ncbi:hypothetical protein LguiB_029646 [Lonicera macranthoides]
MWVDPPISDLAGQIIFGLIGGANKWEIEVQRLKKKREKATVFAGSWVIIVFLFSKQ